MVDPIITVVRVHTNFGDGPGAVLAVDDVSLEIAPGEIFGVIGLAGNVVSILVAASLALVACRDKATPKLEECRDA